MEECVVMIERGRLANMLLKVTGLIYEECFEVIELFG